MTREEQISNGFTEMMKGFWGNQDLKVPDFEEPCKQEPCEDCISRLIVQEEISKSIALKENSHQMYKRIQAIPPVTPQQKVGKWMIHPNGVYAHLVCSKCLTNAPYDCKTNYCPNCGAKMEVEE